MIASCCGFPKQTHRIQMKVSNKKIRRVHTFRREVIKNHQV